MPRSRRSCAKLLGAEFDLDAFYAFAATEPVLADLTTELRGLRPPIAVEPFESLVTSITAQQVSLHAAFAIRNRLIERFGVRAEHAYSFPTRERLAAAEPDELFALGFSHRKAEYATGLRAQRPRPGRARAAERRRGQSGTDRAARDRRVDSRLVPRPPPRAAPRVAGRRPRRAQGRVALLRRRPRPDDRRGARARRALRPVPEPDRALPPRRTAPLHLGSSTCSRSTTPTAARTARACASSSPRRARVRDRRRRPRRPPRLDLREEPARQGPGARGGRLRAARVGRDQRVPRRALPGAAALAGRPGRARRRPTARRGASTS